MRMLLGLAACLAWCSVALANNLASIPVTHHPSTTGTFWRTTETTNFYVQAQCGDERRAEIARACEELRSSLIEKWFEKPIDAWQPKCRVVVHTNRTSYLNCVGAEASQTNGTTWIAFSRTDNRKIAVRRIDILSDDECRSTSALAHELTHVLLADWFGGRQPPRWLDEGLATLADSDEKQQRHLRDLRQAYFNRTFFSVMELVTMDEQPSARQMAAFYGQSLALVQLLIARREPDQLLRFIDRAEHVGHDAALREVYGIAGMAELERLWQVHFEEVAVLHR